MREPAVLVVVALLLAPGVTACSKKNIDPYSEVPGTVRWYAGVTVPQLAATVQQMFEEGGYRVAGVDEETGRIETEWGKEFDGDIHGWRLTRWTERQKFIALVSRSQHQTEKAEDLVTVLLQIRWEERPPGGAWRIKEEGGAPNQSAVFRRFVSELDARAAKLGARRN
jgi:hypothetical protein